MLEFDMKKKTNAIINMVLYMTISQGNQEGVVVEALEEKVYYTLRTYRGSDCMARKDHRAGPLRKW